jgi:hypothetical protein
MRRSVLIITLGALLLIAAVAGFVVVPEHSPGLGSVQVPTHSSRCPSGFYPTLGGAPGLESCPQDVVTGLPQTSYDALRIATWAVLIVGVLLVIVGLVSFARRPQEA